MKNLIIGVVGDESLHKKWIGENHDLFLVYYGDDEENKKKYQKQSDHYCELKGTKFNIIHQLYSTHKEIINRYKYVFIPDDDIFIYYSDICRLFELIEKYNLQLAQPSILGYFSLPITLPHPATLFRYTNYVEIMCPCFEIGAFEKLHPTFNHNKSCWGIDLLWNMHLNKSKKKLAILDDVTAIHTRPVYCGDNYSNNKIQDAYQDILNICENYKLTTDKITYEYLHNPDYVNCEQKKLIFPNNNKIIEMCNRIRKIYPI